MVDSASVIRNQDRGADIGQRRRLGHLQLMPEEAIQRVNRPQYAQEATDLRLGSDAVTTALPGLEDPREQQQAHCHNGQRPATHELSEAAVWFVS